MGLRADEYTRPVRWLKVNLRQLDQPIDEIGIILLVAVVLGLRSLPSAELSTTFLSQFPLCNYGLCNRSSVSATKRERPISSNIALD
jgi:hypothetical protein